MTRLLALACPGCKAAIEPTGAGGERVLCCTRCATAVDIAHDGLQPYPVLVARGVPPRRGLYWALAGAAKITGFAATEAAVTELGKVAHAGDRLAFELAVPMGEMPIAACHAETLERISSPLVASAWTPAAASPPSGVLGRREAERVAHQVVVTLITRAPGAIHHLELALDVTSCSVLRMD